MAKSTQRSSRRKTSSNPSPKSKNRKKNQGRRAGATRESAKSAARKPGRRGQASAAKPARRTKKNRTAGAKAPAAAKKSRKTAAPKNTRAKAQAAPKAQGLPESRIEASGPELTPAQRKKLEQERIDQIWRTFKKTGDENLRNILVEYHFPLVKYIAERLLQTLPKSIELDDLISAGTFGLLDAIRGFDINRGIKFKTYCSTRIRGSILDELRSQDWVPRLVRLKATKLERAMRKLEAERGREINDYELAEELGISVSELAALKSEASPKTIFSLSEKIDDGEDGSEMEKVETIEDKKGKNPVQVMQEQDVLEVITSNLTKKERLIIIMYYYEGLTMREIGDIMSLTESRVCQIHSNVMARLKNQLKSLAKEGVAL